MNPTPSTPVDPPQAEPIDSVPGLDPVAVARWTRRLVLTTPWLHEEVASRMLTRLDCFRQLPSSWLHWEPALGGLQAHRHLLQRLPGAQCHVVAQDAPGALSAVNGGQRTPWRFLRRKNPALASLADERIRVGMVWANMCLHLEPHPLQLLQRWNRHIDTDGFLMFSCLGPDSLSELRALYRLRGWGEPTHGFVDMHDWGDLLVQAGFAEPVVDMERITLTYSSAEAMLDELRLLGRNFSSQRFAGLRGRAWRQHLIEGMCADMPRDPDGRLRLSFELIYGHAFKPRPSLKALPQQSVPLDTLRDMLRSSRR